MARAWALVGGLPEEGAVERHDGVGAEHRLGVPGVAHRTGLAPGVLDRHLDGIALLDLLHLGDHDEQGHAEALEDRPSLRGA